MTYRRRGKDAERAAIRAAAACLLAGAPLRSTTRKLTGSELIIESGLRRDAVYGDHKDLVEEFQAQVRAQSFTPDAVQKVAEENTALKQDLEDTRAALATERERNSALVRIAAELSLELEQARAELESAQCVPRLPGLDPRAFRRDGAGDLREPPSAIRCLADRARGGRRSWSSGPSHEPPGHSSSP